MRDEHWEKLDDAIEEMMRHRVAFVRVPEGEPTRYEQKWELLYGGGGETFVADLSAELDGERSVASASFNNGVLEVEFEASTDAS